MNRYTFRILAAALLACLTLFSACKKDEFRTGIDGDKPGVEGLTISVASHGSTELTVSWSAKKALEAGAVSFSVQLVESPDTTGGRRVAADMYNPSLSRTVVAEEGVTDYSVSIGGHNPGDKYYLRVRANYKMSRYSPWTWLSDENGNMLIYKVGRGAISEGIESPFLYRVAGTSSSIILKWDAIPDATTYRLEYRKAADASWRGIPISAESVGERPSFKITGLPSETEYVVRGRTITSSGESDYSPEVPVATRAPGAFPNQMSTAAQLVEWLENGIVEVEKTDVFSITADIDLTGIVFTTMDEPLAGTFNGGGHTISGITAPLFYSNEGTITNLTLEGEITSSESAVAALVITNYGTISQVNVNVPITYEATYTALMRVAGAVVENMPGATLSQITNEGSVSVTTVGALTFPIVAGGIAAYSGGTIQNCTNRGDVTFSSSSTIRGLAFAGIAGYVEGKVSGSENFGAVSISALYADGYNDIFNTTSTSANTVGRACTPAVAGIAAYGNSDSFVLDGCTNTGPVSYSLTSIDTFSSLEYQRTQVGGIVANPYGTVKNCTNNGAVNVNVSSSTGERYTSKGHLVSVGGIGGGDWFAGSAQNKTNYTNCTNNGNVTAYIASSASNSAVGGIVGWPGAEASRSNSTSGCKNYGKISLLGPGKVRCGGIHGGSGIAKNCTNYGEVIATAGLDCALGGISGFTSNGMKSTGCKNYGDVTNLSELSTATSPTYSAGGLVGNLGNSAGAGGYTSNCVVRCTVRIGEASNATAGMVVGLYNGTDKAVPLGKSGDEISVSGVFMSGSNSVALTESNYTNYLCGTKNSNPSTHAIYAKFDSTPY